MIYAGGCSMVMGQELVDNDPLNMDNKKTAFPAQLGAYNDAWSNSSNQAIINRLYDFVSKNDAVHTVIIGWTHYGRVNTTPIFHERMDRLGQWSCKSASNNKKSDNVWKELFSNEDVLIQTYKMQVESTYHWLVAKGIKPIFFPALDYVPVDVPLLFKEDWRAYAAQFGIPRPDKTAHPCQRMHDWMVNKITHELKRN